MVIEIFLKKEKKNKEYGRNSYRSLSDDGKENLKEYAGIYYKNVTAK